MENSGSANTGRGVRRDCDASTMTWIDVIQRRATSDKPWLILPNDPLVSESARFISYREICERAARFADALNRLGANRSDGPVVLVFDNDATYCAVLLGAMLAGAIPATRSPPWLYPRFAAELEQIIEHSGACLVVADDRFAASISAECRTTVRCISAGELLALGADGVAKRTTPLPRPGPDAPVIIQYSSGSTREPLGITLSHAAVQSNVADIGARLNASEDDVFVSWLPTAHDMGLIGSVLLSFWWGMSLVFMSPPAFLAKPARWLWAISRFRGTISAAPNFAFSLCASRARVPDTSLEGLDLSSWRAAVNGAEAVQRHTVEEFSARFAEYGFRRAAMCPAYGLAENSLACTIAGPESVPRVDVVDRDALEREGVASPIDQLPNTRFVNIVSTGTPLDGTHVRVVNSEGEIAAERQVGSIELRGTSVMTGYWRRPDATSDVLPTSGWLRTGDLGYLSDGNLYIVGRTKQIIKRAGRRYDGADMADIVGRVPGVRRGCVSVLAIPDPKLGSERIVVLSEVRDEAQVATHIAAGIEQAMTGALGIRPDEIHLLQPGTLPKTSSGKIKTHQCLVLYTNASLENLTFEHHHG